MDVPSQRRACAALSYKAIAQLAAGLRRHIAMQLGLNESLVPESAQNELAFGDQAGLLSETPIREA